MRSNLFEEFQEGRARVLVCTDIASRGVDPDVSMNEVYFILLKGNSAVKSGCMREGINSGRPLADFPRKISKGT